MRRVQSFRHSHRDGTPLPRQSHSQSETNLDLLAERRRDGHQTAPAGDLQPQQSFAMDELQHVQASGEVSRSARHTPLPDNSKDQAMFPSLPPRTLSQERSPPEDDAPRQRLEMVMNMIDTVLRYRTQLQHSQKDLKESRRHLLRSIEALDSRFSSLSQRPTFAENSLVERNASRTRTLISRLRNHRSPSPATAARPSSRVDSGLANQTDTQSVATTADSTEPLDIILGRYRRDMDQVTKHELAVDSALEELSKWDFDLIDTLRMLLKDFKDPATAFRMLHRPSVQAYGSSAFSDVDRADDEGPPAIVEEYFSKIGDIGVFTERLQELEYNHHQGKTARALIAERGDELDVSDYDFLKTYETHRAKTEAELQEARMAAAELAHRCELEGHDPEQYRRVRKSDSASARSPLPSYRQVPLSAAGPWAPSETSMPFGPGSVPDPSFARPPSFAASPQRPSGLALARDEHFAQSVFPDPSQKSSQRIANWLDAVEPSAGDGDARSSGIGQDIDVNDPEKNQNLPP